MVFQNREVLFLNLKLCTKMLTEKIYNIYGGDTMRKKKITVRIALSLLCIFVLVTSTAAVFLNYGSVSKYVVIRTENVTGDYLTAFNRARTAWVIKVENSSATWYGLYTPLQVSGQYVSSFQIQINSRTLERDAPTGSRTNWLQSTMAHEFGHAYWLNDNPSTSQSSLMKHSRDRAVITGPTAYDIENVIYKFDWVLVASEEETQ